MKNKKTSVQNFFTDARGSIQFFTFDGIEFHISQTKAGMLRGGDFHPDIQHDIILKGQMAVTMHQDNQDIRRVYGPNEIIEIPPGIPHLFESLTNTVMLEWREGHYQSEYFAAYRKQVNDQLKNLTT